MSSHKLKYKLGLIFIIVSTIVIFIYSIFMTTSTDGTEHLVFTDVEQESILRNHTNLHDYNLKKHQETRRHNSKKPHAPETSEKQQPNIVFILADDYGFNDIGYHGSQIRTPNLDRLANDGVRLENYYVQPICTPSRSQLLSGRYQIHTGLQHSIIRKSYPAGQPLDSKLLPEKLQDAGYRTHMVGKWHLGFYKKEYIPTSRGFQSFYGYYTGAEDYYTHTSCDNMTAHRMCGYDLRNNTDVDWDARGHYSTHLFSDRAVDIINKHDHEKPLFLYLSYQAVHGPLQVPDPYLQPYANITHPLRRTYTGMVAAMDEGVGKVTRDLVDTGLMDNTVLVFSTDNGGNVEAGANNWPLRGRKNTLWEGGMRAVGFVHSPLLQERGTINRHMIHISDWFPTFVGLAQGDFRGTKDLDGFDQWLTISKNATSPRHEILHNIDPLTPKVGHDMFPGIFDTRVRAAIRVGDWKLVTGNPGNGSWIAEPHSGHTSTIKEPDRRQTELNKDQIRTKTEPNRGTKAQANRGKISTKTEPNRGELRSKSDQNRGQLGTKTEPNRDKISTKTEPKRDQISTKTEPNRGAGEIRSKSEPNRGQLGTKTEPNRDQISTKTEPNRGELRSKTEPNRGEIRSKSESNRGQIIAKTEPNRGQISTKTEQNKGEIGTIIVPHKNLAMARTKRDTRHYGVVEQAQLINSSVKNRVEHKITENNRSKNIADGSITTKVDTKRYTLPTKTSVDALILRFAKYKHNNGHKIEKMKNLHQNTDVKKHKNTFENTKNYWLFNVAQDPYERIDLSEKYPLIVKTLIDRLAYYNRSAVPAFDMRPDLVSNPALHGGVWGSWRS